MLRWSRKPLTRRVDWKMEVKLVLQKEINAEVTNKRELMPDIV